MTTEPTTRPIDAAEMRHEIWEWIPALWRTGNFLLRLIVLETALWPIIMARIALSTSDDVVGTLSFYVPLAELLLVAIVYPLVTGSSLLSEAVRKTFGILLAVTGAKMVVGVYLVLVPVRNSPGSLTLLALSVYGLIFLAPTVLAKLRGLGVGVMALVAVLVTISFIPAFRAELKEWWENVTNGTPAASGTPAVAIDPMSVCVQSFVYDVGPGQDATFEADRVLSELPGRQEFRSHKSSGTTYVRSEDSITFSHPTGGKVAICVGNSGNEALLQPAAKALWEEAVYGATTA